MGLICRMERLRHGKRPRGRREGRRRSKLLTTPLFIQVLGVLHMSAFCNGALAVTSAVRYEHKTDLTAGDLESDGGMGSSPSKTPSFSLRNELVSSRSKHVRHRCVASAADWTRPRDDWQGKSSYLSVASHWNRRRTALFRAGSSTCAVTSAFLPPPSLRRCALYHQRRPRAGSRGISSPIAQPSSRRGANVGPDGRGGRLPIGMTTAMAVLEAVVAVVGAGAAARFSLPVLDRGSVRLCFPSALLGGVSRVEGPPGGDRRVNWGGERSTSSDGSSTGRGSSSPLWIHLALLSLVRWLLSAGRLGVGRSARPSVMRRVSEGKRGRDNGAGRLPPVFYWSWPLFGGDNSTTGPDSKDRSRVVEGKTPNPRSRAAGSGMDSRGAVTAEARTTTAQESRAQKVQLRYPRPQSKAYPRPRVDGSTLLGFDSDESTNLTDKEPSTSSHSEKDAAKGKSSGNPMLSGFLCRLFARMITKRARLVEGLEVYVDARSNREAMSGLLQEVGITLNRLELENLRISGGAMMTIRGLDLKVLTLLWRRFRSFKKPFEISGSYVFTSEDLANSPMVRRLVESMMNATLRKLETLATNPLSLRKSFINISQVTARRSRLVIDGDMVYDNARVPFNYRTSIGVKGEGHVVYLKGSEVFWENVGGSLTLPLGPLQTFDVDIGDHARVDSIRIVNSQVAVQARFVLSPFPPLVVASMLKRAALRYDVGERLSVIFDNIIQNMKIL